MGDRGVGAASTTVVDGIEVHRWAGAADLAPLVLLHEGLGSARLWRGFPGALAAATGRRTVAFSRRGHGRSGPLPGPHGVDYMHREAAALGPLLRDTLDLTEAVLVGHSDGASIALLHAADPAVEVRALVLMAPHVVVEDQTVAGIEQARVAYQETDLPTRMALHHDGAEALFRAWNDVWLSPAFRSWDIRAVLPLVEAPALLVQCGDDQYGTLRQLDLIEEGTAGPCWRTVFAAGGHAPHLAHPDRVVAAVDAFLDR